MSLFKLLLVDDTNNWFLQLFRYAFVGGLAFVVDYVLLAFFTEVCDFHYLVSATLSFIAGLAVNYLISIKWIFKHSKLDSKSAEFTIYAIIGVIGLLLTNLLMYFFTEIFNIYYLLSKIMAAVIVLVWNFVGRRVILFKNK